MNKEKYFNKLFSKRKYRLNLYAGAISLIFTVLIFVDTKEALVLATLICFPLAYMVSRDFKRYYKIKRNVDTEEKINLINKIEKVYFNYTYIYCIVAVITFILSIILTNREINSITEPNSQGLVIMFSPLVICFVTLGVPQLVWYAYLLLNSDIRKELKRLSK